MIRNILIGLVVVVALAAGGAFLLPQHVQRDRVISATPQQVFGIVNDMSRWPDWSPWAKQDPDAKLKFEGPAKGPSAKVQLSSATLGERTITIIDSKPFTEIKQGIDFGTDKAIGTFTFELAEGGTKVTWSFDGDSSMNPIARYLAFFQSTAIGNEYETGLSALKALAESDAKLASEVEQAQAAASAPPDVPPLPAAADPTKGPEVVTVESKPIVMSRGTAAAGDEKTVNAALGVANQKILDYAAKYSLDLSGAQLTITVSRDPAGKWVFDAAIPLAQAPASKPAEDAGVRVGQTFSGKVVKLTHKGPFSTLKDAYERIHAYTKANNLKEGSVSWEENVTDSGETAEEEQLTNVYVAVKE